MALGGAVQVLLAAATVEYVVELWFAATKQLLQYTLPAFVLYLASLPAGRTFSARSRPDFLSVPIS